MPLALHGFNMLTLCFYLFLLQVLPSLQVLARSSPHDKFLLVTRLNGHSLPKTKEEWQLAHKNKPGKRVPESAKLF